MIYSYSQISSYLSCPRQYRYRYLQGWREKDVRANMIFGRVFEKALAAYFRGQDSLQTLHNEWAVFREAGLEYSRGDTWDTMFQQGMQLLERFCQDNRVHVANPAPHLQVKITRQLSAGTEFVAYIDAVGELDHKASIIEWKTSGARYSEQPAGILALDPQLLCYSWLTGQPCVAMVVFVRKRSPEIQYLTCEISEEQRRECGQLVEETISRIEAAQFLPHSGIRFPNSNCVSCSCLGLCLNRTELIDANLVHGSNTDLDWINELDC